MKQRVFISFTHSADLVEDVASRTQAIGLGIAGRYVPLGGPLELLPDLRQQLRASDAVVVIFGPEGLTEPATDEIEWSYEDGKGLVGIRLNESADIPRLLHNAGAEILDWSEAEDRDRLGGAIRAAVRGAQLMERARTEGTGSGASCARPARRRE